MIGMSRPGDRRIAIEGQSNAVGYADANLSWLASVSDTTLPALAGAVFDRVYIFNPTSGNYEKLRVGVNNMAQDASHFGPEFGIAVRWMRETAAGNLYIDKNAWSGQPISYFVEGTSVFAALVTNTATQNAWLAANRRRPAHMGWLWVQGENDYTMTQSAYETALTGYITSRRTYNLQPANSFNVLAQIPANSTLYGTGVAAAKTHYASVNPTLGKVINFGTLGGDSLHMNAKGQVQCGYDAYSVFFSKPTLVLA